MRQSIGGLHFQPPAQPLWLLKYKASEASSSLAVWISEQGGERAQAQLKPAERTFNAKAGDRCGICKSLQPLMASTSQLSMQTCVL